MTRPQTSWNHLVRNPWTELPVSVADALRPNLDAIATEMIDVIRREVPHYRRPLDSELGRDLVAAVRRALFQFVELIENPSGPQEHNSTFFRRLGKAEFLTGRGMDELQAAYRVGARVGSRRYTEIGQAIGLPTGTVLLLSEAVLVHINELANDSVRGYTEARLRSVGDLANRRRVLAERLLDRNPDPAGTSLEALAYQAEWLLPSMLACVVVDAPGLELVPDSVLDGDVLVLSRGGGAVLFLPGQDAAARVDRLRQTLSWRSAALGPTVTLADTWLSAHCARLALRHARRGLLAVEGDLVVADDHLATLILLGGEHVGRLLATDVLAALSELPVGKANRLEETLQALLRSMNRSAPEVATELGIHPQTARYRLRQLETLFGDRLDDPDFRFAAELVLRGRSLRRGADREARGREKP
jgi:hypothetical protein